MNDILAFIRGSVAVYLFLLTSQPLFVFHIVVVIGLAIWACWAILREGIYWWFTVGLCIAALVTFHTYEWWKWGLSFRWQGQLIVLLYGLNIVAGMGSGWLLYAGGWRRRITEPKVRRRGLVLILLGLLFWNVGFLITVAANIWWATI